MNVANELEIMLDKLDEIRQFVREQRSRSAVPEKTRCRKTAISLDRAYNEVVRSIDEYVGE
jgi:hypothetical protein